jgi:taurine dioxygenase
MMINIEKLNAPLGAEVTGINIGDADDDADDDAIVVLRAALNDHHVLVIRNQSLEPGEQVAFAQKFGPLVRRVSPEFLHPDYPDVLILSNRVRDGKEAGATDAYAGEHWHSDLTYAERPSFGSMLHALEVADIGGDTAWANMHTAYDTLPAKTRTLIDGLKAIHIRDRRRNPRAGITGSFNRDVNAYYDIDVPDSIHPMVRTHPETGRKSLFVSPRFTVAIEGMDDAEAQPLLDDLFEHQKRPEFIYRHKWRIGDLVFWDNRCTIHLACGGIEAPGIRHLHRTSIAGDVPF